MNSKTTYLTTAFLVLTLALAPVVSATGGESLSLAPVVPIHGSTSNGPCNAPDDNLASDSESCLDVESICPASDYIATSSWCEDGVEPPIGTPSTFWVTVGKWAAKQIFGEIVEEYTGEAIGYAGGGQIECPPGQYESWGNCRAGDGGDGGDGGEGSDGGDGGDGGTGCGNGTHITVGGCTGGAGGSGGSGGSGGDGGDGGEGGTECPDFGPNTPQNWNECVPGNGGSGGQGGGGGDSGDDGEEGEGGGTRILPEGWP